MARALAIGLVLALGVALPAEPEARPGLLRRIAARVKRVVPSRQRLRRLVRRLRPRQPVPTVLRGRDGVVELRRGTLPRGTVPIPPSRIPPEGLFVFSVRQGAFNINTVARGPRTRGYMSEILARMVRSKPHAPIERVNISDVVNEPTLEAMRRGTPFLEAPQLGRMVARTISALGLRPTRVKVDGGRPRLNVYIEVAPKGAAGARSAP